MCVISTRRAKGGRARRVWYSLNAKILLKIKKKNFSRAFDGFFGGMRVSLLIGALASKRALEECALSRGRVLAHPERAVLDV